MTGWNKIHKEDIGKVNAIEFILTVRFRHELG